MGKFNEIQEETTQSWGSNSFTTTVKEDTVEFDSAKDKFTFKDEVEVPSLKVNGESVSSQVQSDWNQNDSTKADYIKNKPSIETQVQADWNQNNSSAKDYIKNRICSEEESEVILFDDSLVLDASNPPMYFFYKVLEDENFNIPVGELFTVTINDKIYEVVSTQSASGGVLSNGSFPADDESFIIKTDQAIGQPYKLQLLISSSSLIDACSLKLEYTQEVVSKIDEKFIPGREIYNETEDPTIIKGGMFYYGQTLPLDDNDAIKVDFSDVCKTSFKKTYGDFYAESATIDFVDENGNSLYYDTNLSSLEIDEHYYYDFTLLGSATNPTIIAIFTKLQ